MAGTIRRQYPASLRTILVPCTARVDPEFILRSLRNGADGVMVVG
ncbi:MAG: hydrogenase iron-sulfur subunit [Candidatus Helarchaeales archaeon]